MGRIDHWRRLIFIVVREFRSLVSWDLCWRGVLEVILDDFEGVEDHFCSCCLIVIDCVVHNLGDNTVSSDTKLN